MTASELPVTELLRYPTLDALLQSPSEFAAARRQLDATRQALDRAIRQGTPDEAARASQAAQAWHTVGQLLDEMETLRQEASNA
ncbi:MAG: hypothetical protein SNJ62_11735 [Chloracidobacterium sp.]|uniref:Uncharacterized protein n=1 Tax=Chloracidobacterium validum TaxID=2821543 RepID=A0ABX8BCD2_9BACT|nr:hypothetical protein [Chloracidobacterium validum]QUW04067.1 hypothetical protein J8C06_13520 [Chloracidobacterium validum]